MSDTSASFEERKLALEEKRIETEASLKRAELELKSKEDPTSLELRKLALEEKKIDTEASLKKAELELKAQEGGWFNRLFSPLTTTLFAGILTLAASALGAYITGVNTLGLEKEKFDSSRKLETQKQQHELILKMIGVTDPELGKKNIQFLAESGLIADDLAKKIREAAAKNSPLVPPPLGARSPSSWRLAGSLIRLREQIDQIGPTRRKTNDATIQDRESSQTNDHLPNANGVVTAFDVTHDPANGVDVDAIVEALRASRDRRIKYIVWKQKIFNSHISPWEWRPYAGAAREGFFHISVVSDEQLYDDRSTPWVISGK